MRQAAEIVAADGAEPAPDPPGGAHRGEAGEERKPDRGVKERVEEQSGPDGAIGEPHITMNLQRPERWRLAHCCSC